MEKDGAFGLRPVFAKDSLLDAIRTPDTQGLLLPVVGFVLFGDP
jgi:hypothetical protein